MLMMEPPLCIRGTPYLMPKNGPRNTIADWRDNAAQWTGWC